jgi:hypothetical protein
VQRRHTQAGARARGDQLSKNAAQEDRRIAALLRQYERSDLLQLQYATAVAFLKVRTDKNEKTIRRALKRLQG